MVSDVATARTVIAFDKDRRRSLLARYAAKHLSDGQSASASDQFARADKSYDAEFQSLLSQFELANLTLTKFEVERLSWETCRSLLSFEKQLLDQLPE